MSGFVLEHGEGPRETPVPSVALLDVILDRVEAEAERLGRPSLPTLYDENGRSLAIGVGHTTSVVAWHDDTDPDTGDLLSRGDASSGIDEISFYYGNQYSSFPGSAAVAGDVARRAMREFRRTGRRPSNVRWQQT